MIYAIYAWIVSHLLPAFPDASVGVLIPTILWICKFREYPPLPILFLGPMLAVLPDVDVVLPILRGEYAGDHHQMWTHFPAFMFAVVVLPLWIIFGRKFAVLSGLCLGWHFVHDSPPLNGAWDGGGIAWLWPLSNEYWWFGWVPPPPVIGSAHALWSTPSLFVVWELLLGTGALLLASWLLRSRAYVYLASAIVACVWLAALVLWFPNMLLPAVAP